MDGIAFAWWEALEWKDINGHILSTNLRYSEWLTFFSAEIPSRGDLGFVEIKGRSSSTSFRNSALLILKFFFQSSSKHLSSFILRHQRSVRPGFIQKHFFFRSLFLNDLWRQRVIAEFSKTDRRARLFVRLISLLNIRFVNEFDKFMAETTAAAAVVENMSLTMDAMFAILIQCSCKHGMKWPCHHVNAIRNQVGLLQPGVFISRGLRTRGLTTRGLTTRGLTTRGSYNELFYSEGFLQPGVVTTRDLKTRGCHNQGFLQPGALQPAALTTKRLTTRGFYNQGPTIGGFYKEGSYNQWSYNLGLLQTGVLQSAVLTTTGLTTRGLGTRRCYKQRLLQPGLLQPGALTTRVLTSRGFYNQGCYNQWLVQPGVLQQGSLQPGILQRAVFTTRGLRTKRSYKQASYNKGFLQPVILQ